MKTYRAGVQQKAKKANKKHKRPCRSAPATPTGVVLTFHHRESTHRKEWHARVDFDPVEEDVADPPRSLRIHQYQVQLQATNASGVPLETHGGKPDTRSQTVKRDDDERAIFPSLAKPKTNYYRARVRAMTVDRGKHCWSAWSGWTDAEQPVSGTITGPPAPDGLTLSFDRVEGTAKNPFRALCVWNETAWWDGGADSDPVEGAASYDVKLAASNDGGSTTANVRRETVLSHDDDADTQANAQFTGLKRNRKYRFAVRAKDSLGRVGAWSSWTAWAFPTVGIGAAPSAPQNVTTTAPTARRIKTTWDPPTDDTDVDRYEVKVYKGATLKETVRTRSHFHRYDVSDSDRSGTFHVDVIAIDAEGNQSGAVSSADTVESGTVDGSIITPGTLIIDSGSLAFVALAKWGTD